MKLGSQGGCATAAIDDLINGHHAAACYGKRNFVARDITKTVIDRSGASPHLSAMLSKSELLAAVKKAARTQKEVADLLGLAPARISELFKGERDLTFDEGRKLIKRYQLSDGTGGSQRSSMVEIAAENGIALVDEVDLALGLGGQFIDADNPPPSKGFVPFKSEWLRDVYRGPLENLKVVRGKGDSMQPTIQDGDFVLVDLSQRAIDDQDRIWAVAYGDLGMIKRVRQTRRGSYILMSDNSVIPPIEAVDGEMYVMGRVIWIGRRI